MLLFPLAFDVAIKNPQLTGDRLDIWYDSLLNGIIVHLAGNWAGV